MTPDWTNPADYPFDKNTPLAEWAWEFLRRNPKYRDDFRAFRAEKARLQAKYGDQWRTEEEANGYHPRKLAGESDFDWALRCEEIGEQPRVTCLETAYALTWGLDNKLPDPALGFEQGIYFLPRDKSFPRLLIKNDDIEQLLVAHPTNDGGDVIGVKGQVALIAFDLHADFNPQIEAAIRLLRTWKKRLPKSYRGDQPFRERTDNWTRYLRALDALDAKATKTAIADELGGYNRVRAEGGRHRASMVNEWLRLALRLRDHGHELVWLGLGQD